MPRQVNIEARAAQRRVILEAAGRLFAARGFHQTGMAAICKAAGMSPGGLYRYFASKAALIEGIVAEERAEALTYMDALQSADDLRSGLVSLLLACAEISSDAPATALSLEIAAEGARNPTVGKLVDEAYGAVVQCLVDALQAAQSRGEVASGVDPVAAAAVLASTANGLSATTVGLAPIAESVLRTSLEAMVDGLLGPREDGAP